MVSRSRRRFLGAVAGAGVVGTTGCLGGSSPAQRRIDHPTQPPADTWPTAGYDARNTRHSPDASPPESRPTPEWSVSLPGVATSVVVGPEFVYASSDEATVAVAPDGTEEWRVGVGGGLTYVEERLYVSADTLVALDAASGEEIWRETSDAPSPGSVYETSGTVYVTGRTGVRGIHPDSGERRWQTETARYPRIVADERRVGVVTGERVEFFTPGEVVEGPLQDPAPETVGTLTPSWRPDIVSATLVDGSLYLGQFGDSVADLPATARRYDLVFADERWVTPFDWSGVGGIAVDDERVYAVPYRATLDPLESSVVALNRETGTEQWHDDGAMLGTPAVGGGVVVAGGAHPESPSVCVSESDETETDETCSGGEAAAESGILRAFDAPSGERLWTVEPGASYGSYPLALVGERIYHGDAGGLHALA